MEKTTQQNVDSAVAYYEAFGRKDGDAMASHLHPSVHLIGPLGETDGKDAVLEAARKLFSIIQSITVRASMGEGNRVMLACDLDCTAPIGLCRTAVLMDFEGGLIKRTELFLDARPFERKK